ncbi:MAG: serine protease [Actinobacteria bacterium]|nr:serine protease [Actinomycetota bacterium]
MTTEDQELSSGPEAHADPDPDDLDGFETSMSRFSARLRKWLVVVVALSLVVPLGGWLIDELAFRRSGADVAEQLGEDARLADAVMLVRSIGCDGRVSTGSGFLTQVGDDVVLVTNRHVVAGARTVGLRPLEGGTSTTGTGYRLATNADVAVVELDAAPEGGLALPIGPTPDVGQDVQVVGFPAARPYTTAGTVAEVGGGQLLLELAVSPGVSGSPVVDADGTVVGQVFARTDDGDGVATAGDALRAAVESAEPAAPC